MVKLFAAVCLSVACAGCGSSSSPDGGGGGGGLETFSAYCIAGANAYCVRLYQCEPSSFPGTVAECEATPDQNCGTRTCPAGTTFNSANASTCVTSFQNELCANVEAGDVPQGCSIQSIASNVCT
jgi:hypothetical protein